MKTYIVDSSTVHSVVSALARRGSPYWTEWERRALAELTMGLLYKSNVRIPAPPRGVGRPAGATLADHLYDILSDAVSHSSPRSQSKRQALQATRDWVKADPERVRVAFTCFKRDPSSETWMRWAIARDWPYHVRRLKALIDPPLLTEVAAVLRWTAEETRQIKRQSENIDLVTLWSQRFYDKEVLPPSELVNGYCVSCLIRGRYYSLVAEELGTANIWHSYRNYVLEPVDHLTSIESMRTRLVEVYLAGLICAAAREEAREDDAITSWANNLSLVRCKNLDIPPESDANAAIRKAVHLARDSGLNIKWHALDRFLAAAQDHFVLPLVGIATGLALAPLGGPLLTMQVSEQIVEQMARPFADSLTERIRTTITESDTFRIRAARRGAERLFAVTNADLRAKGYTNESRCAVVILVDNLKNIMLYLRDNKSNIPFPNTWGLLGGLLKEEETPEDGIRRELREELGLRGGSGYELRECKFLFTYPRKDITRMEYVFRALLTERIENLTLHEGQRLELFCQSKIECVDNIVPHHREILLRYFECV